MSVITDTHANAPTGFGEWTVSEKLLDVSLVSPATKPLRQVFKGYSIWLELEEVDSDFSNAIDRAAAVIGSVKIPSPHVTVIYGMSHLSEEEVRSRFMNKIRTAITSWPALKSKGVLTDVSYDGVDGQEMDMAWTEITHSSSDEHEALVDKVYSIMYSDTDQKSERSTPWLPHSSLVYDNPESLTLTSEFAASLVAQFPSLLNHDERNVTGISLWDTNGTIDNWKCIEHIKLGRAQ